MDLHVVGGFLGSGKTTAIINALKTLLSEGRRVGVITNDKGRYMVDTAFLSIADIPTAEVLGGCFRCNYGDFQTQIAQLQTNARPDVLFAESVGSCVDLVGPVLIPLSALQHNGGMHVTYSVFVDIRLLRRHLAGRPLPFSDNITYIFKNQLEEANILLINKADLLSPEECARIAELAHQRYPEKMLLLQSSLTPEGVAGWLNVLQAPLPLPPALTLDYGPYIAGAAELAWYDEHLTLTPPEGQERTILIRLIADILGNLQQEAQPVAHLKLFIQDAEIGTKLSFTALDNAGQDVRAGWNIRTNWEEAIPQQLRTPVTLTINARVQMEAKRLETLMTQALNKTLADAGVTYDTTGATALTPHVPG